TLHPITTLLLLLTERLALPCLLLSMVSGLLQTWYERARLGDPYPLYSVSNIGSMSALILYPVLIEPRFGIHASLSGWTTAFVFLAALCAATAFLAGRERRQEAAVETADPISLKQLLLWIGLSALNSVVLLAYTTYLTIDIAPVPLLWVLPLCLYLLSFIICFGNPRHYYRAFYLYLGPALWGAEMFVRSTAYLEVPITLAIVFCFCMTLTGELVLVRPKAAQLPTFYLAIAFGGVLGAMFVDLAAPMLFGFYAEPYLIALLMACLLVQIAMKEDVRVFKDVWLNNALVIAIFYIYLLTTGVCLYWKFDGAVANFRNFYGAVSVLKKDNKMILRNGMTIHGEQFIDPVKRDEPTKYYRHDAGLGSIDEYVRKKRAGKPIKIAVTGLGTGTMACYGRAGDELTFYEIDPKIEPIARRYFSFLNDSKANISVVTGDARQQLAKAPPSNRDWILVDAFNGDAIPVHLLTEEAVKLYFKHLSRGGLLVFHISNRYLDLAPVIANLASALKLHALSVESDTARFVVVCQDPVDIKAEAKTVVHATKID
ncbi:MAG TPA: fused MFS/spermidine synthase, partial [Chroococcales cyanobacterium]